MKRLECLDALRGIAALLVVLQHLLERVAPDVAFLRLCNLGLLGVLVFFLISGFVVPSSIRGDRPLQRFAIGRAARLLPALWLSVACMALLLGADAPQIAANMLMVARPLGIENLSGVYWTLTYELAFYGLCVLLYLARSLKNPMVVGVLLIGAQQLTLANVHFMLFPCYLLLGLLLRLDLVEGDPRARPWARSCAVLMVVFSAAVGWRAVSGEEMLDGMPRMMAMVLAVPLFALVVWLRPRPGRVLVYLGTISYSVYLFQDAVFTVVEAWWPTQDLVFVAISVPAILVVASVVYRLVEQPFIALGRRSVQRGGTPAANFA